MSKSTILLQYALFPTRLLQINMFNTYFIISKPKSFLLLWFLPPFMALLLRGTIQKSSKSYLILLSNFPIFFWSLSYSLHLKTSKITTASLLLYSSSYLTVLHSPSPSNLNSIYLRVFVNESNWLLDRIAAWANMANSLLYFLGFQLTWSIKLF